jgi:hypothetical protein
MKMYVQFMFFFSESSVLQRECLLQCRGWGSRGSFYFLIHGFGYDFEAVRIRVKL